MGLIVAFASWGSSPTSGPSSAPPVPPRPAAPPPALVAEAPPADLGPCAGLEAPDLEVLSPAEGSPTLCLTLEGSPPDVRATLYVDGERRASHTHDACSWPNAGRWVAAATLPLDDGRAIVWGSARAGVTTLVARTEGGAEVSIPAVAPASGGPEVHFAAVVPGSIRPDSWETPGVADPPAPVAVAACAEKYR
ncbi:MAG: hypothetical protein M5U14_16320 [Acidimicrobiia bacterium]|nr:hypothetical protein [Acidimicrobiia bacterium]